MRISDLTPKAIEGCIVDFYDTMNAHFADIGKAIGNESYAIRKFPRKMGNYQFPYFFAAELDNVFRYALGGLQAAPSMIRKLCEEVESLLSKAPNGQKAPLPDAFYIEDPLGFSITLCRIRMDLRSDKRPLTPEEVMTLSEKPKGDLEAAGIIDGDGLCPTDKVKDWFEATSIRI